MMATTGAHIPQSLTLVTVDFDPDRKEQFKYSGDAVVRSPPGHPDVKVGIESGAGVNLIIFRLESPHRAAAFAGHPFQWVSGRGVDARPAPTPPGITSSNHSDRRVVMQNLNSLGSGEGFKNELFEFHLIVLYAGKMYASPDPTIINQTSPDPPPFLKE